MKIDTAEISFSTRHHVVQQYTRRESLVRIGTENGSGQPAAPPASRAVDAFERSLSAFVPAGRSLSALSQQAIDDVSLLAQRFARPVDGLPSEERTVPPELEPTAQDRIKIRLLMRVVEQLLGKKLKFIEPDSLAPGPRAPLETATPEAAAQRPAPVREVHYIYHERYYEAETTTFNAHGVVRTADGQEISLSVELTMSRQFVSEHRLEARFEQAVQDPLVINFEGTAAELSQTRFHFDLDSNGTAQQIYFVGPGSGFLAVDRNNNGKIDNGSELFGPTTGNGFTELAAHDEDGNGWIDTQDSIYDRLRVWMRDSQGNDQLIALGELGIGAIYLGHVTTPFAVKDKENQLQAQVRSSGIYLTQDGAAGTVQQLDLVV